MKPAWSVIFLTTLIGAGQGLFLAMVGIEGAARVGMMAPVAADFYVTGSFFATLLLVGGLGASFLHLGHPERAWRAIAMWRTFQDDPQVFSDGGSFVWRNGDTSDPATGIKCMIQTGGNPAGDPQPAAVQTTTWNYVW